MLDTAPSSTRTKTPPPAPRPPAQGLGYKVLLAIGALFAFLLFVTIAERVFYSGRVLSSVSVQSVDLGGKSEADARRRLEAAAAIIERQPIEATVDGRTLSLDPGIIDARVDVNATLSAARAAGHSTNPLNAVLGTLLRRVRPDRVPLTLTYDKQKLDGAVSAWVDQASSGRKNAEVKIDGTNVTVTEPKTGVGINSKDTKVGILAALPRTKSRTVKLKTGAAPPDISLETANATAGKVRAILATPVTMTVQNTPLVLQPIALAPTLSVIPKGRSLVIVVDSDKLRAAFGPALAPFEKAPVEAGFKVNGPSVTVTPSEDGIQVDLNSVGSAIAVGQHNITATPRPVQPLHNTEWAKRMNITELVSTFTTNHPPGQERVKNIHRAADVVNGTVVEPGAVFSLNDKLGKRTAASGYVSAPVYVEGEFKDDFGGGVSQFTTTLYNATFFGGYKDIAHAPHSIYISRYPMGREATLNFGSIDLKFQNDTDSGLLIRTNYSSNSITVTLYGSKAGRAVRAEGPNILEQTEPETEYTEDPTLAPGKEKETQAGHPHIVVENFRIISRPGQPDKRERYVWTYEMMKRKVSRNSTPPPSSSTTTTKPKK